MQNKWEEAKTPTPTHPIPLDTQMYIQELGSRFERIVEQLEEKAELLHKMAYMEISKNGHSWDFECFSGQKMAYEDAIEIVRNGGKE